jgi:methylaspartate ammonia-lyase
MRVTQVLVAEAAGAFANDDQAAIRAGAARDGFVYTGPPRTPGFRRVRQPADALSVMLVLEDGAVVHGDAVSVQYAGAAGRDEVLVAAEARGLLEERLRAALVGADISSFRGSSERIDALGLPVALRYGASQALLGAAAHTTKRTVAETVADEYATGAPLREVPIFAQCGEARRDGVDRAVLREADELPHGLINNTRELVGERGEPLVEYVRWVRDRVLSLRDSDTYEPVLHFDCYGTLGEVFPGIGDCARYLVALGEAAAPLRLRIEQPVQAPSRAEQIGALARLRGLLEGTDVQLVADEWCNTLDDVRAFVDARAADMIQVKTPDLGSLDEAIQALLACRAGGVEAYCGGSCTETERAGQICAGVAMGVDADLVLARPGMGVDEAIMVTRNEMRRTLALVEARAT